MGIDYTANYGIGYEVFVDEDVLESNNFDYGQEFIEDILEGTDYSFFEVGDEGYGDDPNDLYIIISKSTPLDKYQEKLAELAEFLSGIKGLTFSGGPLVGGLHVWWIGGFIDE